MVICRVFGSPRPRPDNHRVFGSPRPHPDKCRVFGGSSGSTGRSGGSSAGKAEALPNSSSFLSGGVLPLAWIDRVKGLRFRV